MFSIKSFVLLGFITLISAGFYDSSSNVVKLDSSNFKSKVLDSKSLWFIEFYAPWCGHCQRLTPEWEKLANTFNTIVNIGAVDMTTDGTVGTPYGVQGYPTLKFFGEDKSTPIDYSGGRSASDMLTFVIEQIQDAANERLKGKEFKPKKEASYKPEYTDEDVIVLTDSNFESEVYSSEDAWFIEFYAQWCGHCKNLEPEWNDLSKKMKNQEGVKIAKIDAHVNSKISSRFNVKGYPTIKFFPSGRKNDGLVEDYAGARDSSSMSNWILEKKDLTENIELEQLTNAETFKKYCKDAKAACVIVFLPHIYDSSKEERNNYLSIVEDVLLFFKSKPLNFLWSQAGDHFQLEDQLGLGSGFPAVVTISLKKNVFSVMRGAFSKDGLLDFTNGIIAGKEGFRSFQELPSLKQVQKWDGEDKKPEVTEETLESDVVVDREL